MHWSGKRLQCDSRTVGERLSEICVQFKYEQRDIAKRSDKETVVQALDFYIRRQEQCAIVLGSWISEKMRKWEAEELARRENFALLMLIRKRYSKGSTQRKRSYREHEFFSSRKCLKQSKFWLDNYNIRRLAAWLLLLMFHPIWKRFRHLNTDQSGKALVCMFLEKSSLSLSNCSRVVPRLPAIQFETSAKQGCILSPFLFSLTLGRSLCLLPDTYLAVCAMFLCGCTNRNLTQTNLKKSDACARFLFYSHPIDCSCELWMKSKGTWMACNQGKTLANYRDGQTYKPYIPHGHLDVLDYANDIYLLSHSYSQILTCSKNWIKY